MALVPIWLHVLGVVIWVGGLAWQAHVLAPLARGGDARLFAEAARRARPVTWTAIAIVALTGFYNVTQLGALEQVMRSGAGLALAGKFTLVLLAVALAAQRDFAHVPRLVRATTGGTGATATATAAAGEDDPASVLRTIAWLDRVTLLLAIVIIYLGLFVSRGKAL
jgi:putative copper export protein